MRTTNCRNQVRKFKYVRSVLADDRNWDTDICRRRNNKRCFPKTKECIKKHENFVRNNSKNISFPDEEVVSGNIYIVLQSNAGNTLGAMYEKPGILMENIYKMDASV